MNTRLFTALGPFARRAFGAAALGTALSVAGVVSGAVLQACSAEGGSTGGHVVSLRTRVVVSDEVERTFTTALGWDVTLAEARVSAGPFYYFDGAPPLVRREQRRDWRFASRLLGLSLAHAHPGHYQAGNALGQMLGSASIDLLAGETELPDGEGVSGTYRSARFTFAAPSGRGANELDGHVALAVGKAEKPDERPRFFRAFADLSAIEKSAGQGRVEGCAFEEVDVEGDGTVSVTVNPRVWFDLVDFSEADEGRADAPADLPEDSQPQLAFVLGTTQLSAYEFRYSKP